mgnify:CR=1 FL=1
MNGAIQEGRIRIAFDPTSVRSGSTGIGLDRGCRRASPARWRAPGSAWTDAHERVMEFVLHEWHPIIDDYGLNDRVEDTPDFRIVSRGTTEEMAERLLH